MVNRIDFEQAIKGKPADNWFSVMLFRLMFKSDKKNYALLRSVYPVHAFMWEYWKATGIIPDPDSEEFKKWVVVHNEDKILKLFDEEEGLELKPEVVKDLHEQIHQYQEGTLKIYTAKEVMRSLGIYEEEHDGQ